MVPKDLLQQEDDIKEERSLHQNTSSFLDIFQNDLRIRIYEDTDEQLLLKVLRSLDHAQ